MTRNRSTLTKASSLALAAALATQAAPAAAQSFLGTPTVASGSANIVEGPGTTNISFDRVADGYRLDPGRQCRRQFRRNQFPERGNHRDLFAARAISPSSTGSMSPMHSRIVVHERDDQFAGQRPDRRQASSSTARRASSSGQARSSTSDRWSFQPRRSRSTATAISSTASTVTFNQAPNPNAAVNTVAGSQINANGAGSYVALVAPSDPAQRDDPHRHRRRTGRGRSRDDQFQSGRPVQHPGDCRNRRPQRRRRQRRRRSPATIRPRESAITMPIWSASPRTTPSRC